MKNNETKNARYTVADFETGEKFTGSVTAQVPAGLSLAELEDELWGQVEVPFEDWEPISMKVQGE